MPLIFFSFLFLISLSAFAQNIINHEVEPKGVYAEINLSRDINTIQQLSDKTALNSALIASVEKDASNYTPPVLYVLSNILFSQKKYNEACFWFYVAQLRARYDVNRCLDKTANADAYNQNFGANINEYAFKHMDSLKVIVQKVVTYVKANDELYDQRWINLSGIDAMKASISDSPIDKQLSVDKNKWPAIKKKTIDDYYDDFKAATNKDIIVNKKELLAGDYRLFQSTPAWQLAKAVADSDTTKIKEQVNKNKSLLAFREPRFGQPLLTLAVRNTNYNSVKTLLELGADPNMQDLDHGESPTMAAADIGVNGAGADSRFLKLLLKFGGNPNAVEKGGQNNLGNTPLIIACENSNLEYVEILVEAGADVNFVTENNYTALQAAVTSAGIIDGPDIAIYLIKKGANYKYSFLIRNNGEKVYITDFMRDWLFDLGSDAYKKKMWLVDFLKKNDMDYRTTKIPEQYLKDYPKEYLEKY